MTIELSGFPPRREVMLRATLDDARGRGWSSQAVFHTDGSGAVDLASTAPLSGCYTDADAEGLLWSLEPAGEAPKAPFDESSLASLNVTFWAEQDGTSVASATVERYVLASDCRAIALKQDGLVGTLFRPAGDGPFPTVLVIGETWIEPPVHVTPRPLELLALLDKGLTNAEIATALEIAAPTVKTMLERLYRRAGVSNRVELLAWSRARSSP
jgi:DNA-binding CsgD family transcriptional regulator